MKKSGFSAGILLFVFSCCFNSIAIAENLPGILPCTPDSVKINSTSCHGICDGEIAIYTSGTGPLYYNWLELPDEVSSTVTGACSGTYHFVITDSAGCFYSDSVIVEEPPPVPFTVESQGTSCPGGCSGFLTVVPGDTLPYTFYWPGYMSTGPQLHNLCQGTYNVIVTDVNGCSRIETADVIYIPPFQLSFIPGAASCVSACNGMATVSANGTGPFNYQWGTGPIQNTQTAFNLCTGSYLVNVTDSIGCTVTDSVYIDYLAPIDFTMFASSATCFGGCDGVATAIIDPPGNYSYEWNTSPPQFSYSATGLCAGIYTVAVTDLQSGCQYFETVEVQNPTPPTFTFDVTPALCNNSCSGAASVTVDSSPPFTYLWSNGSTNQSDSLLCPGIYTVTVTDSAGCSSTGSVLVDAESLILYSGNATCNNVCDGYAGLILPYPSEWFIDWLTLPVQHSEIITGLCEGIYSVAVVDSSGCELNGSVEVLSSVPVQTSVAVTDVSCIGVCDGVAVMSVTGSGPFQFLWNTLPPQSGDSVSNLCSGIYAVIVTDSLGCSITDSVIIASPGPADINYFVVPNSCDQVCDAVIEAIPASAGNYSYQWNTNPVQTGSVALSLCPGLTFVEVTDSAGCVQLDSVMIIGTPPLNINFSVTGVSCSGSCDGFVSCNASGGNPGFSFEWSNGYLTPQIINVCPGTYVVTVTDIAGCSGTASVTVNDPLPLNVTYTIGAASCSTCADGYIDALVTGGNAPYFYLWTPGGVGGPLLDSLTPGYYNLCISDNTNCTYCEDIYVSDYSGLPEGSVPNIDISIFPNPIRESAYLRINNTSLLKRDHISFALFDVSGRKTDKWSIKLSASHPDYMDFEIINKGLPDGIYFFRVVVDGNIYYHGKFIINSGG